ncbi:MAG: CHAT domain-containing protein [Chloroflexi bacterium]|nr:CHAT domain-containing protein [Chloroflexota bacterium]
MAPELRALVVEDNDVWRRIIKRALERNGCVVDTAANEQEARLRLSHAAYDLVTLDMALDPDEEVVTPAASGGWGLLVAGLARDHPEIFVYVISASFGNKPRLAFELHSQYGVRDFLDKGEFNNGVIQTWTDEVRRHRHMLEQSAMPEPLDVTLRFRPAPGSATILWDSVATGQVESTFVAPYDDVTLPLVIRALESAQDPNRAARDSIFLPHEQTRLTSLGLWNGSYVPDEAHRIVGSHLYTALTNDRHGGEALAAIRAMATSRSRPIAFVLRFPLEAVELAALPWEALHDGRLPLLLGSGGHDLNSCVRYLDLPYPPVQPQPGNERLHILALSPVAEISAATRAAERAARLKSWESLRGRGLVTWEELEPVTVASLNARLRQGPRPDIVHFYGHGMYRDGQGYLLFDDPVRPGSGELINTARLAAQLGGIRLIVLHACQSAGFAAPDGILTGIAPALSIVSEAVVAMQLSVRIDAATRFSGVLYDELARGRSLQAAVADARRTLFVTESDGASWYVPTLYIRSPEQRPLYFVKQ